MEEIVRAYPLAFVVAVILLVPPLVVLVLSVVLYIILLPFVCLGSCFGSDPWRTNFRFYSVWCLTLLIRPVRRTFAGRG